MKKTAFAGLLVGMVLCAGAEKNTAERAREAVDWLLQEKYEDLFQAFSAEMQKTLPLEVLRNSVGPSLKPMGKVIRIGAPVLSQAGANRVAVVPVEFDAANVNIHVSVNPDGRIAGMLLRPAEMEGPAWERPAYSKPDTFTERDITVGEDEWKLPGTLTLPKGKGPFAAVVLVHGSGPNDRDETVGGTKPFKDLAEGLASQGIAVVRYEKRTKVFSARMASMPDLTVQQETIDDALRASALARRLPEIDPRRVYVLGHSLGGYLLPRILNQDPKVMGGIVLAGNTRPLEDLILEQSEYLASQEADPAGAGRKRLEEIRKMVAAVKALKPDDDEGPAIMGMPPRYLLDLRGYDPAGEAKKLKAPMLILQGERDYQVTMTDFENWKAALGGRKDVVLKSYPALNHLFVSGVGKSTPAEYRMPGHVDGEVIRDIARWVLRERD